MTIHRLNHAVLYVRDVDRSVDFYRSLLGFEPTLHTPTAAFLRAPGSTNDHDLGLFAIGPTANNSEAGRDSVGLYHLAWEVDTLAELVTMKTALGTVGSLVGSSNHGTSKSLYAVDPDGLEFEVVWLIPAHLITDNDRSGGTTPLDLDAELARFGPDKRSGIGISRPDSVGLIQKR